MKVTELRIGNFVSNYPWTELLEVTMINKLGGMSFNNILFGDVDKVQAIPITEEWLIKFGFEKTGDYYRGKPFLIMEKDGVFIILDSAIIVQIQHVHQLQNLYFALTGEELVYENNKI